ncbi:MAG TPA: hypothetical protein VMZ53_04490 [Kofleriaceae bacterium]|nr:hypothetical protein [Kofleriaceae bacterium]
MERVVRRLGSRCIPLLGRELLSPQAARRDAARDVLALLAKESDSRERVLAELRRIANDAKREDGASDEAKVAALGLLAEHGERTAARFADPGAIQRRSALALASSLDNEADVAAAADMMIHQLGPLEIAHLIEVMVDASRGAAYHLAVELCARLDLDAATRECISELALGGSAPLPVVRGAQKPAQVAVLVDPAHKVVVVVSRKISARRWRRWAVLIGAHGAIDDCVHDERTASSGNVDADHAPLIARLVADGYQVASTELERARGIVAAAARQTTSTSDEAAAKLPSAYYLGRDLLDLGEAHLGGRVHAHPTSTSLGRAVELIADGDHTRAQVLLARCADSADVAAATGASLLAQQRIADALPHLLRAAELEPEFPLHHWNLASVLHHLGDPGSMAACYAALRRFLRASEQPTGLFADPDQPARVGLAIRLIADLERTARLTGLKLDTGTRRKRRAPKREAAKR